MLGQRRKVLKRLKENAPSRFKHQGVSLFSGEFVGFKGTTKRNSTKSETIFGRHVDTQHFRWGAFRHNWRPEMVSGALEMGDQPMSPNFSVRCLL